MRGRYRAVAASGMVVACAAGMSALGAGTAAAAPNVPLDSCNTSVPANAGDTLTVTAKTVLAPQLDALRNVPVVGPPAVAALSPALSSVSLLSIPVQQSPSTISGSTLATTVLSLPAVAGLPPEAQTAVRDLIANSCQVTVKAAPPATSAAAPVPFAGVPSTNNAPAPAAAPTTADSAAPAPAASLPSYGHVPKFSYDDLKAVPAGGAGYDVGVAPTLPPKPITGYGLPSTGLPAVPTAPGATASGLLTPSTPPGFAPLGATPATQSPSVQPVSGISEVTALPGGPAAAKNVPAEAVFAAMLLSLTAAALVRTWVLRRSAS